MANQTFGGIKIHFKKFLLSGLVIMVFVFYAIYERAGGKADVQTTGVNVSNSPGAVSAQNYKDGKFTGSPADAYYGLIQVQAVVSGGKITDIIFLNYPQDRQTSISINQQALPILKSETIAAQSASVDAVSGATETSSAFVASLASALNQAAPEPQAGALSQPPAQTPVQLPRLRGGQEDN